MMDDMPWIQLRNRVPGRVSFFTWDDLDEMLVLRESRKMGIKVRFMDVTAAKKDSNIVGVFISGRKKDLKEINEMLFEVDKKLLLVNKEYAELRKSWIARLEKE